MKEIKDFLDWFFSQKHYAISDKEKILLVGKNDVWEDAFKVYEKEKQMKRCGTCNDFGTVNCPESVREPSESDICESYKEREE